MKNHFFLLLFVTLIAPWGASQLPPEFYVGINDYDDQANDLEITLDGGFLFAGTSWVPGAGDSDGIVVKADSDGLPEWTRKIGTPSTTELIYASYAASDGSYYFVGNTDAFGAGNNDIWILKLDNTGNVVWEKTIGTTTQEFNNTYKIEDGGSGTIVVLGENQLVKMTSAGTVLWKKTFTNAYIRGVTLSSGGGYIVSGDGSNTPSHAMLMRLDANGNVIWANHYAPASGDYNGFFVVENPVDGSIYLSAERETNFTSRNDYVIIKTDDLGNIIWANAYGQDNLYTSNQYELILTNDGGVLMAGDTPASNGGQTGTIVKISPSGTLEWSSEFGYNQSLYWDDIRGVVQLPDNTYAFAGWGRSFATAQSEESFYFGRPDANGQTSGSCYYYDRVLQTVPLALTTTAFAPGVTNSTYVDNAGTTGVTTPTAEGISICTVGYCAISNSATGTADGDFIDGVQLSSIINLNTGATGGPFYNDYSTQFTTLSQSTSYTIDITSGDWLAGYPDYYAAWIDYNQDNDFDDPGEKLGEFLSTSQFTAESINFTVPAGATPGQTAMRVRGVWDNAGNIDPCTEYDYGETEDYTIIIQTNSGGYCDVTVSQYGTSDGDYIDGVALESISNLNTGGTSGPTYNDYTAMQTNLTQSNTYTLDVTAGAWLSGYADYYAAWIDYNQDGDFADAGEKLGEFLSTAPGATQTINFTVPTTAPVGATRMRVRGVYETQSNVDPCFTYNYGETEDYTVVIQAGSSPGYCDILSSAYGTSDGDYIDGVELGSIVNTGTGGTTGPFYNDYTAIQTNLSLSGAYDLDITAGIWLSGYPDYYAAWIDYNQDNDFDDPGEKLGEFLSSAQGATETINFTVPASATMGTTRMRVRGVYSATANIDPCTEYDYGETEDYTVNIVSCATPSTPGTIAGVATVCQNDVETYSIAPVSGATSYNWTLPSGWTGSSTTTSITATAGATGGTISVTAVNACGSSSAQTFNVIVNTTADATITPAGPFCVTGSSVTLSAADGGGTWSGTGVTNGSTGTFDPSVAGVGTHTITYTISGSCGDTDTETITVTGSANATIAPAGPFCETGSTVTLAATDPGGTWSGTGITNSTNGTFNPVAAGPGTHTITYTISGSCGDTDTETITVNSEADATITPAGPFCDSDAATNLTAAETGGTWSGAGITNGTAGTFDPSVAGTGSHTITYTISGACGDTDTETIMVNGSADATIVAAGPFCNTDAPSSLTAVDGGGTWTGTGITNSTTGTFDPSAAGTGTHTITYTIPGTCGDTDTEDITVIAIPAQPSIISGATSICGGATATYSVTNSPNTNYQWTLPAGWTGASSVNSINATAGANGGNIEVVATNACGTSAPRTLTVTTLPQPTVVYDEDISMVCDDDTPVNLSPGSPAGGTYNGQGVTGNTFDPSVGAGTYDIIYSYTDGNGCSNTDTSTIVVEVCTGIEMLNGASLTVKVFPNPSEGPFTMALNTTGSIDIDRVMITDVAGRIIEQHSAISFTSGSHLLNFDLSTVERGVYTIILQIGEKRIVHKVIVQ